MKISLDKNTVATKLSSTHMPTSNLSTLLPPPLFPYKWKTCQITYIYFFFRLLRFCFNLGKDNRHLINTHCVTDNWPATREGGNTETHCDSFRFFFFLGFSSFWFFLHAPNNILTQNSAPNDGKQDNPFQHQATYFFSWLCQRFRDMSWGWSVLKHWQQCQTTTPLTTTNV